MKEGKSVSDKSAGFHRNIFAAAVFSACAVYMFIRIRYGMGMPDEAFYFSVPLRLLNGDRLFNDEWHISQLQSLITYLPVALFTKIHGSTEGLIMAMRYLFFICHTAVAGFVYWRFRKYGNSAILLTVVMYFYIPGFFTTLSYYVIPEWAVIIAATLICTGKRRGVYAFAGLLCAAAVIDEPLFVIIWPIYTLCIIIRNVIIKRRGGEKDSALIKNWLMFTVPFAFFGFAALITVIICSGFGNILAALPDIMSDPSHNYSGKNNMSGGILNITAVSAALRMMSYPLCAVFFALPIVSLFDKNKGRRKLYLTVMALVSAAIMARIIYNSFYRDNYFYGWLIEFLIPAPLAVLGLEVYIVSAEKNSRLLLGLYLPGLVLALCLIFSSNYGAFICGSGLIICDIASVLFIDGYLHELALDRHKVLSVKGSAARKKKTAALLPFYERPGALRAAGVILAAVLLIEPVGSIFYDAYLPCSVEEYNLFRTWGVSYSDEKIDTVISAGPLKGVKTKVSFADDYYSTLEDLSIVDSSYSGGNVLVLGLKPYCYLYLSDIKSSCFSSWFEPEYSDNLKREIRYLSGRRDKIPDVIYLPLTYQQSSNVEADILASIKDFISDYFETEITNESKVGITYKVLSAKF